MVRSSRGIDAQLLDIDAADLPSDDEMDPDYTEGETSDEDDIPQRFTRDRARWMQENHEELAELFMLFKEYGERIFGRAFFQCGTINKFGNHIYKYTTPGVSSDS